MRKNNTIIAIFIAVSLILQGTIALADHNQMEEGETGNNISEIIHPQYIAISSCHGSLTIQGSGKLRCRGDTTVISGYTAWVKVELQKYDGGWHGVTSWTNSPSSLSASVNEEYTPSSGKYRLKITHKAMQGDSEIESTTSYSSVVTVS